MYKHAKNTYIWFIQTLFRTFYIPPALRLFQSKARKSKQKKISHIHQTIGRIQIPHFVIVLLVPIARILLVTFVRLFVVSIVVTSIVVVVFGILLCVFVAIILDFSLLVLVSGCIGVLLVETPALGDCAAQRSTVLEGERPRLETMVNIMVDVVWYHKS